MGRNQHKKEENTRNWNTSPPTRDHNSSTTREHNMTKECHELTETGFRRWIITNFSELKEHILTQCKETKNLEKRLDEMLTRITSLEKNIKNLIELKNTAKNYMKQTQVLIDKSIKQKKEYLTSKINSMK